MKSLLETFSARRRSAIAALLSLAGWRWIDERRRRATVIRDGWFLDERDR